MEVGGAGDLPVYVPPVLNLAVHPAGGRREEEEEEEDGETGRRTGIGG